MAPTVTQDEDGGEGSGSRSRRPTRGRRRSLPTATTPSKVGLLEPPTSSRTTRTASKRAMEKESSGRQSKKRKTMMAGDEGRVAAKNAPKRSKRSCIGDLEAAEVTASASADATDQGSSDTSAVSSPIRRPFVKRAVIGVKSWREEILESDSDIDSAIRDAYRKHDAKYSAKESSHEKLITLESVPYSCLASPCYGPTRDSAVEMVLKSAKFVLGLSSYINGKLLKRTSGFIIEWDKESKMATVITSSLLICTKSPSCDDWLAKDEYDPHAEVHVHLLDKSDTIATAQLSHIHKHYNFALFKVKMDLASQIPSFSTEVNSGQEMFVLGRDKNQYLMVGHGSVLHMGPGDFNRHHIMFASCKMNECFIGGPVIKSNGQFLGMISGPGTKFIHSVLILKCLHMLKKFDCVPRLHIGMKFMAIRYIDPVHREKISRKCNVDVGLIVTEVSGGSIAEKAGIRIGDIVEYCNGEVIATSFELEHLLLCICEEHLDNGDNIGSDVEIPVGIYRVRKDSRCKVILTLKIRDEPEIVARGEYDVATAISAMVSPYDQDSGHEKPHVTGEDAAS